MALFQRTGFQTTVLRRGPNERSSAPGTHVVVLTVQRQ